MSERKGKAKDKELVGSIPKVRLLLLWRLIVRAYMKRIYRIHDVLTPFVRIWAGPGGALRLPHQLANCGEPWHHSDQDAALDC